jgi:hypothetical protein
MRSVARIMAAVTLCAAALWSSGTLAASHREAPLIANDPTADNTDFYMFRSWTNPNNVVFILNVIPMQDPGAGPNYFNFGDDVIYRINVDTNGNGKANDLVYEIRFKTELRGALASQQLVQRGTANDAQLRGASRTGYLLAGERWQGLRRPAR